VSESTDHFPTDIEVLQARLAAALAERDVAVAEREAAIAERDQVRSHNVRLQHLLNQLQRMQFGRRSQKLDAEQFNLAFEDIEQTIAAHEAEADKKDPGAARERAEKRRAGRGALPAHLPREHVTIEPEDTKCPCCRAPMHVIGEDAAERLDVVPAQFRVIVTHRPKYACRACEEAVVQAPAPERLIKGGLPTEAMVASVLVAKYAWHLPLYRQAQMLGVQGLDTKRSVLAFWVGYAATELKPVYLRLRELILMSAKVAVDETTAPVLDPGRGRTKQGYFWAIARDDRPWRGRSAGDRLQLCAWTRCDPRAQAARGLSRHRAMRRLCGLQDDCCHARRGQLRSPSAGPICAGSSSTSPRAAMRRSRAKRSNGSLRSMRSRRRSAE
jgi:transposase